ASLTFHDLKTQADALAGALARLGIVKGDRVGIMLPNCPQYIVASFAILRLGAIVVNINPSYTAREFAIVAAASGARRVIRLAARAPLVRGAVGAQPAERRTVEQIIVTSPAEYSAAKAPPPQVEGALTMTALLTPVKPADLPRVDIVSAPSTCGGGA